MAPKTSGNLLPGPPAPSSGDGTVLRVGIPFVNSPNFCVTWVAHLPVSYIEEVLARAGRGPTNAVRMKQIAKILIRNHEGRVPCDYPFLMSLPGVGPKIASILMKTVWGVTPVSTLEAKADSLFSVESQT